ncbi:MAG: YdeI/OmpD-associated family protein [Saprospiraceae bacterium]
MSKENPKADFFFDKAKKWKEELEQLRLIPLQCELEEELKWGVPCYTFQQKNIVLIHAFKDYCALLFHKGVLLKDPKGILIQQTENVQAARQVRFTSVVEIVSLEKTLKAFIFEACELEEAGVKVPMKKTKEFTIPEEFEEKLKDMPALKKAFEELTPGRQRGYLLYFGSAKQSKTRIDRIEKYTSQILEGKGLED